MTVVVNELDLAPSGATAPAEPAPGPAPSPEAVTRHVERAARLRDERARRLKAC